MALLKHFSARATSCLLVLGLFAPILSTPVYSSPQSNKSMVYPPAKKVDHVDDYHGTKVPDPYRWLENPDSEETRAWVEAENKVTFGFLEEVPARAKIKDRLTKLWNYEKYGVPAKFGDRYIYSKNNGLQNQNVLYTTASLGGQAQVLLDPNTLSTDGTVALSNYEVSDDGKLFAYGLSASGSDWMEWRVRDIATSKDLPDLIKWVKFSSVSWLKDGSGFFYSRYDEPNESTKLQSVNYFQKLYFHKLGTPQSDDVLVYERPDEKEWQFEGTVSEDGKFLIITVTQGTSPNTRVFYKELSDGNGKVTELLNKYDASYEFLGNDGTTFWFKTNQSAPRGRVIAIEAQHPQPENWKELIAEAAETMQSVSVVNNQFVINYLKDARTQVKLFLLDGKFDREVTFPGIGTATGFRGKRKDTDTFYSFTSFTTPTTIYRYDLKTGKSSVFRQPKVGFKPGLYETKQVFYTSKDGTKVPMFISHKKDLKLDGNNPTVLYGYGGFNISLTPTFSVSNLVWMEMGGIFAQPNLRGGGEYGEEWHLAGTKLRKQNVFDDFISAGEWLIANKYTSTPKLAIYGGSNGGLLVGACMTQRPDLFGACMPAVGVMDMLRFQKFTIGWAWTSDYGSSDNPEEFKALYAYSPLHNIKPGTAYPPTMVTTADHDDRVVPAHSFKFAAAMQAAQSGPNPILIRIDTKAGHGAGKPTAKIIDEAMDRFAFLVRVLNIKM